MQAEREAFETWVRKMFVCSEHSFVRAHPYGYINTVSSQTFEGRVQPNYADVQMLWETWLGRANGVAAPMAWHRSMETTIDADYGRRLRRFMEARGIPPQTIEENLNIAWLAEAITLADQYANGNSDARLALHVHLASHPGVAIPLNDQSKEN